MIGIEKFLKNKKYIFDVGTGPSGSYWWHQIDPDSKIVGCDFYFFPKTVPDHVTIFKYDASKLHQLTSINKKYKHAFDLVVANHILEHVSKPNNLIKGISQLLKKGGEVYVGIPDGYNFTDTFYHLIHQDGGGHLQRLKKSDIIKSFKKNGLKLISDKAWPDDWLWLEKAFDYKYRKIPLFDQKDLSFIANTFRKELTSKKGYFYGWELIFKKL
jgi:SAM-dependent methyltransferase